MMLDRTIVVTLLACASGCMSSAVQNPIPTGDEAAIRDARAAQNDAIEAGAFDEVASYWQDDITVRAGLGTAIVGRGAYRAAFSRDSGTIYDRQTELVELSDRWPLAWEEGSWIGRRRSDGERLISGRYAAQWLKIAGEWKIRSEMFVALECSSVACSWPVAN